MRLSCCCRDDLKRHSHTHTLNTKQGVNIPFNKKKVAVKTNKKVVPHLEEVDQCALMLMM